MHVYLDTFMHECIEWQQYIEYNNIQGTIFLLKFDTKRIGSKIYAGGGNKYRLHTDQTIEEVRWWKIKEQYFCFNSTQGVLVRRYILHGLSFFFEGDKCLDSNISCVLTGQLRKMWRKRRIRTSRGTTQDDDVRYCSSFCTRPLWMISKGETSLSRMITAMLLNPSKPLSHCEK